MDLEAPPLGVEPLYPLRKKNPAEIQVIRALRREGYDVMNRGWPDLLAIKGEEVRLIEVKSRKAHHAEATLKPHQSRIAEALEKLGVKVELIVVEE